MANPPLQGLRVLLTRPHPHNDNLQAALTANGAEARCLPLLAIEPVAETPALRQSLMNLDLYQAIVVVSPNAARIGLELIEQYWPQLPVGLDWLAVGKGTANQLAQAGIRALVPDDGHDSEALLRLPRLQEVAGQRVLILRGQGGRELLSETLRERGARVDYAELYRRAAPDHPPVQVQALFDEFQPRVTLLFSGETFDFLWQFAQAAGPALQEALQRTELWLPSTRAVDKARSYGLQRVHLMTGLDDASVVRDLAALHVQE